MMDEIQQSPAITKKYNDYSQEVEDYAATQAAEAESSAAKRDKNFPERLHYLLTELENDGLQHIACWRPHGRCFVVSDKKEFESRFLHL